MDGESHITLSTALAATNSAAHIKTLQSTPQQPFAQPATIPNRIPISIGAHTENPVEI